MILKDLGKYGDLFDEYTELRVQENRNVSISMVNGNVMGNSKSASGGVSARVYKEGVWGFASSPEISDENIRKVVEEATGNALFLHGKENSGKAPLPDGETVKIDRDFSTNKERMSQKEIIDFLHEIDSYLVEKFDKVSSRTVVISTLDMEKSLITSTGTESYSMVPRTILHVVMSSERDGENVELYKVFGGFGQVEDHLESKSEFFNELDIQYRQLLDKSEGIYPEAGIKECILSADLAGILAHEAIGHTTEADTVLGGSIAADHMGEIIASPLITLIDYANEVSGKLCPVPVFVDDEGSVAKDTVIIEDGVLKSFMHNKESASHFNVKPTGNARAYDFSDEPLIRMKNTAIKPGTSKLEDMIASIDDGYYLMKSSNGQADSTSEFMFGIVLGYEIKNGKLGKAIKDTTISGVAFDVLKSVTMVSDDMVWSSGGMCGKKQMIPVGMGGPAVKCKVNIGGR